MLSIVGCGRSSFEGLLQLLIVLIVKIVGCGRSSFEGLLQLMKPFKYNIAVVEGPVLRDYYNSAILSIILRPVVEGPVLRDYYNF